MRYLVDLKQYIDEHRSTDTYPQLQREKARWQREIDSMNAEIATITVNFVG